MNNIKKLSHCDPDQIVKYTYDEGLNASRVTLVGLDNLTVEPKIDLQPFMEQMKQSEVQVIETKVPVHTVETKIEKIEVPTIITQEKIVELPLEKIIVQEKIVKIDVPVIVKEVEYKEVQIPIVTERLKEDKVLKVFQVIQSFLLSYLELIILINSLIFVNFVIC